MEGGELFAKISERTTPFTEQGKKRILLKKLKMRYFNFLIQILKK